MSEDREDGGGAPPRRIGLFVDLENLSVSNDRGLVRIDPNLLLKALETDEGDVSIRRAYADWSRLKVFREAFLGAGFEQVQATHVNRWKNDLDMIMALDALEVALTDESLGTVALASSDVDFAPLVRVLRRHGRRVIGLGWAAKVGERFRAQVDRFVALEDVLGPPQPMDRRPPRSTAPAPVGRNAEGGAAWAGRTMPDRRPAGPSLPDDAAERIVAATLLSRGPGSVVTFGAVRQAACRAYPDRPPQTWSKSLMLRLFDGAGALALVDRTGGADLLRLPITVDLDRLPLIASDGAADAVAAANIGYGGAAHADAVEAAHAALADGPADVQSVLAAVSAAAPDADAEGLIHGLIDSKVAVRRREDGTLALAPEMDDPDTARYAADAGLLRRAMTAGLFLSARDWARLLDGDDDLAEDFAGMLEDLGFCDPAYGTPRPAEPGPRTAKAADREGAADRKSAPAPRSSGAFADPRDLDRDEEAPAAEDAGIDRSFAF